MQWPNTRLWKLSLSQQAHKHQATNRRDTVRVKKDERRFLEQDKKYRQATKKVTARIENSRVQAEGLNKRHFEFVFLPFCFCFKFVQFKIASLLKKSTKKKTHKAISITIFTDTRLELAGTAIMFFNRVATLYCT